MQTNALTDEEEITSINIINKGRGELFTDPDPDRARIFFQKKSRKMANKAMVLSKAIETFVHDGDYLALGGFGGNRSPIAACHEILRQGRKHMGFAGHTTTHEFEILSAGEAFDRVDAAYIVGLEARGLSPCARRYMQSGKVFELLLVPNITETLPPTEIELKILREEVDPHRYVIGR